MLGKPSDSSSPCLWMTPLKILQLGGGNGWELGWIVYGILLPKAFWIMAVGKKVHYPESLPVFWVPAGTLEQSSEGSHSDMRNAAVVIVEGYNQIYC